MIPVAVKRAARLLVGKGRKRDGFETTRWMFTDRGRPRSKNEMK